MLEFIPSSWLGVLFTIVMAWAIGFFFGRRQGEQQHDDATQAGRVSAKQDSSPVPPASPPPPSPPSSSPSPSPRVASTSSSSAPSSPALPSSPASSQASMSSVKPPRHPTHLVHLQHSGLGLGVGVGSPLQLSPRSAIFTAAHSRSQSGVTNSPPFPASSPFSPFPAPSASPLLPAQWFVPTPTPTGERRSLAVQLPPLFNSSAQPQDDDDSLEHSDDDDEASSSSEEEQEMRPSAPQQARATRLKALAGGNGATALSPAEQVISSLAGSSLHQRKKQSSTGTMGILKADMLMLGDGDDSEGDEIEAVSSLHNALAGKGKLSVRSGLSGRPVVEIDSAGEESSGDEAIERLIMVTYELPVVVSRSGSGEWQVAWEEDHSFVSSISVLQDTYEIVWIGWPGIDVPLDEREEVEDLLLEHNCIPVFLPHALNEAFFDGFCCTVLWPLLHYVLEPLNPEFGERWDDMWRAFQAVNTLFASAAARQSESRADAFLVHDYHLMLVPAFLRKRLPRAKVGYLFQTPFPTSDIFRTLPARVNLLRGLLASDVIGFHTYDYCRHFVSCCKRVLDLDVRSKSDGSLAIDNSGRQVFLAIRPPAVEAERFRTAVHSSEVEEHMRQLRAKYFSAPGKKKKIMLGMAKLDIVQGFLLKLQAFERLLTEYPEWRDSVLFVIVFLPSRPPIAQRQAVHEVVIKEADQIRRKFGEHVVDIVEHEHMSLSETVALYRLSDVAIMSSFWDGHNPIPYEYTACQDEEEPGTLVLSEFMGAARALSGSFRVNPWDLSQVSEVMREALALSPEQRQKNHKRRRNFVECNTIHRWATRFLSELDMAAREAADLDYLQVGWGSNVTLVGLRADFVHLEEHVLMPRFRRSARRLLLLDYDGTLTPEDEGAPPKPNEALLKSLERLTHDPTVTVFILSGRRRLMLGEWFGDIERLGICAEKGCFIRWPGSDTWEVQCPMMDFSWKDIALDVLRSYTERTAGSFIENKESAIVWHFDAVDPEYGKMQAGELTKLLRRKIPNEDVEVVRYRHSRIVEIKPRGISKGNAVERVLDRFCHVYGLGTWSQMQRKLRGERRPHGHSQPFVLCVGDDRSDEEMFAALQRSVFSDAPAEGKKARKQQGSTTHKPSRKHRKRRPLSKNTFTCCVGIKPSRAHYYFHDHEDVIRMLEIMAEEVQPPSS